MNVVQINGNPQEVTVEENAVMGTPWVVPEGKM